jgi:nucleoside-triphosphatase
MQFFPNKPLQLNANDLWVSNAPLNDLWLESKKTPQLLLVTGLSGIGKTAWCSELVEQAQSAGAEVKGLLSPPVFENQQKVGFDLVRIETGERRKFARKRSKTTKALSKIQWEFDPEVMEWGNDALENIRDAEILVLDELGPLEFNRGEGFLAGLKLIDEMRFRFGVVVIRSSLVPLALERWPFLQVVSPNLGAEN